MENLTLDQIKGLARQTASPSISIFLPTHRAGREAQQDPVRFKNLLRGAEKQLLDGGMGPCEAGALLQPAQALLDDASFWNHQHDGLAVFMAIDDFHYYALPFRVEELLVTAQSYYVKPILPLFTNNGHYYILAISLNEVRLFEGTRYGVGQVALSDGISANMEEALRLDDLQKSLQMHSGGTGGMFHGQGPSDEEQKVWVKQYLNLVDTSLTETFREQNAPLVLAGVDYLLPMYRKVSEYQNIMEAGITGSPDHLRPEELQEQAWRIVETYFQQETKKLWSNINSSPIQTKRQITSRKLSLLRSMGAWRNSSYLSRIRFGARSILKMEK
ncbi:MAG: baeRF7 domain-containing protein [Anaerolineales bacterium]